MNRKPNVTLEEMLEPTVYICARCRGPLKIYPYIWKKQIKSINYCKTCFNGGKR